MAQMTSSDMAEAAVNAIYDDQISLCKPPPSTPEPEDTSSLKSTTLLLRRLKAEKERNSKVTPQLILRAALEKLVPLEELEEESPQESSTAGGALSPEAAQTQIENRGDSDCSPLSPLSLDSPNA